MPALSLSALDTKLESVAEGVLKHVRQSVDLKDRIKALESGAKPDLDAFKADILGSVKGLLADLRTEIIGEVKAGVSDNVGAVEKAVADLTSVGTEPAKADAPTAVPVVPGAPATPTAPPVTGPVI